MMVEKRPASRQLRAKPGPKQKVKAKQAKKPWNTGRSMTRSDRQWLHVPRQDMELFYGVLLFWSGPIYAFSVWLTLCTSRRASEILRLRASDIFTAGGPHHDKPYVLLQKRAADTGKPGMGKLGSAEVAARISQEAVHTIQSVQKNGLERAQTQAVAKYAQKIIDLNLQKKSCTAPAKSEWPRQTDSMLFPSFRSSRTGWMTRQSVWNAIKKTREIMYALTGKKRYQPAAQFSHVTLHGATRHSSAALFLEKPSSSTQERPSVECILEIQNRQDRKTFEKHYFHLGQQEMDDAVAYASVPNPFSTQDKASLIKTRKVRYRIRVKRPEEAHDL